MTTITFGQHLRHWRSTRRLSQLELASAAEVSQRHVSFLETGRSKPSPEMVVHLGRILDLPLREQNLLLTAAGYAPAFSERNLDDPDLDQVRGVLQRLLDAYGPYPAYIIDRGLTMTRSHPR
ncbi:MAG: helix-turn-helix transcriptional regulator, partial [Actinomycetota bacterium]